MNMQEKVLIKAVLASVDNRAIPKIEDLDSLVLLSRYHLVQNIIAEILPKLQGVSSDLLESVMNEQALLLIKDANQEAQVSELIGFFEENKIPVVLLKGWYLKKFYPRADLRAMADIDIFVKQSDEFAIHQFLKSSKFDVVDFGGKKDNVYQKEPFIILEVHKNLFLYEDSWNEFFNNDDSPMYIWNRVERVEKYQYVYRMDDELFFVYMIAHIAKHLIYDGGIGLKSILDVWIFMKNSSDLNMQTVSDDLSKLGLTEFSENIINLTQYWFDEKDEVENRVKLLGEHILACGVYGNSRVMVATKEGILTEDNSSRLKYLYRRAFPTFSSMKTRYPQLKSKKWLLPFLYIKRLWYSLIHRTNEVKGEIRSAKSIDMEQVRKIQQLYKEVGLK